MCLCINKTICVQATPSSFIHTAQLIDVMGRLTNHLTNEKTGKKGACWAPEVPYAQGGGQREEKLSYLQLDDHWPVEVDCCAVWRNSVTTKKMTKNLSPHCSLPTAQHYFHSFCTSLSLLRFFTLCFSCWGCSVFDARARQRCHFSIFLSNDRPPLKPI